VSSSDSDKSKSNSGNDPRLNAFLRQARAVIAAERGLNPRSHLKLQSLAQSLKLPDELFQTAIEALQTTQKPTEVAHWERAFVDFLDREFRKLPDQIVSIRMETRAVDLAIRKYQLSEVRARQLIAQSAEALGLGRIAPAEAKQYVKQLITDRIGDATSLADEIREQLYLTGHTWGLERSEVDELVLDQLIRNRGIGRSRAGVWLLLFLVSVGAVGYAGYRFAWLEKLEQLFVEQPLAVVPADPKAGLVPPPIPRRVDWWTEEFQAEIELLKENQPDLQLAMTKVADPDAGQRASGFRDLIDWIVQSEDSQITSQWESRFCELFFLEPDPVTANSALNFLGEWLAPEQAGDRLGFVGLQAAYRANRLFNQLELFEPAKNDATLLKRQTSAFEKHSAILGQAIASTPNADVLQHESESAVALGQWNHVVQACWSTPARCAIVVQPLYDLTKDKLDRTLLNQFRARAIESILDVDPSRWKDLTAPISQAIEVADEIRVNNWIRYYQSIEDRDFSDFLGQLLVRKTGVTPDTNRPADIEQALSEVRLQYQNNVFQPILERNQAVDKLSAQAQQAAKLQTMDNQPELIAKIAFAANLSLAMANAAWRNDQGFAQIDDLLNDGSPVLRQVVPLGQDPQRDSGPATTTPSASENRQKTELVAKLSEYQSMSSASRQTTMEQLGRLAVRFEQISYPEATVIADYILSPMPLDEWLNVEKNLTMLKKWPNLSLAIADRLPQSNPELDQALTIYRLMFDDEITVPSESDWKSEISKRILSATLETLQRTAANDFTDRHLDWKRLQIFLTRVHETRYLLMQVQLSRQSPSEAGNPVPGNPVNWALRNLGLLINDRKTGRTESEQLSRLMAEIMQDGRNELEQTVLANQTTFEVIADRMIDEFPDRKSDIEQLRVALHTAAGNADLTGQRLLVSELALLQLWDILRSENIKLLYHRN
jgi:hypothetical protein